MQKIKSGDEVIVIAGKSKGQRGKVIRMDGNRVLVEGVAMVKRHTKPNPSAGVAGGIVEREAAIHRSNVMLFNASAGKGDRVGINTLDDGRRVRVFKSDNEVVDI